MRKLTIDQLDTLLLSRISAIHQAIEASKPETSLDAECKRHWLTELETLERVRDMIYQAHPASMLETNYARFK